MAAVTWLLFRTVQRGGRQARWIRDWVVGYDYENPRRMQELQQRTEQPLHGKRRLLAALALIAILAALVTPLVVQVT